jgi:cytochrome c peroxidase
MASLDPAAQRGLKLFMGKGNCRMCHSSPAFTDGLFHASLVGPGPGQAPADPGRFGGVNTLLLDPFNALGAYADNEGAERTQRLNGLHRDPHQWGAFKTPTLRNVAMTAPYMHAGQFETLEDVVRFYSTLEGAIPPGASTELVLRPLDLDDGELGDLVAFLESLTDVSVDPELKRQPASPQGEDR